MNIPTSYRRLGHQVTVSYDDALDTDEGLNGKLLHRQNKIVLTPPGAKYGRSHTEQTFLHEQVHDLLIAMGQGELGDNEKFVDTFASLLHQARVTEEGVL